MKEIRKNKYRITELLNKLPHDEYCKALKVIPRELGISEKTFLNYRNINVTDIQDIPAEKVAILEKLFAIGCGQLANYSTEVRSIAELTDSLDDVAESLNIKSV